MMFLIEAIVLYGLDVAQFRGSFLYGTWCACFLQTVANLWFGLLSMSSSSSSRSADSDMEFLPVLLQVAVTGLFYVATACWISLQCQWLIGETTTNPDHRFPRRGDEADDLTLSAPLSSSLPRRLEATLHGLLPPVASALLTKSIVDSMLFFETADAAATAAPHIFAMLMTASMLVAGSVESSFVGVASPRNGTDIAGDAAAQKVNGGSDNSNDKLLKTEPSAPLRSSMAFFAIRKHVAYGHTAILLVTPILTHLAMFWGRIVSRYASTDDLYDLLLTCAVPFLLRRCLQMMQYSRMVPATPYFRDLQSEYGGPVAEALLPLAVTVVASFAVQQRYLLPLCHRFAYRFLGAPAAPNWLLSLYWTAGTVALLASLSLWGRTLPSTGGQPVFGEYHEDAVQLALAVSGFCFGKAVGMPWNMTPLPILALLGLSLWITTRLLRYLAIFLFVVHATGVLVFSYRFIGIDQTLTLPFPNADLTLLRFGMLVTSSSIVIGLVAGLAVRSTGGYMAQFLKKIDLSGALLFAYGMLLAVLEIALLKRPIPWKELVGVEPEEEDAEEMLYSPPLAYLTSIVLTMIAIFLRRARVVQEQSSAVTVSLAVGKSIAVFINAAQEDAGTNNDDPRGIDLMCRVLVASMLCAILFAPRAFMEPVHVKASSRRSATGPILPGGTLRVVFAYAFVFLPISLMATIPYVLLPLVKALIGSFRNDSYYNDVSPPISELIGAAISVWGLACVSMLNHYLPDGGGEALKKLSALAFLMGIGTVFAAPSLGMSARTAAENPYASLSSLGSQLMSRSKSRTGVRNIASAFWSTSIEGEQIYKRSKRQVFVRSNNDFQFDVWRGRCLVYNCAKYG
jgi:hypothetical protein